MFALRCARKLLDRIGLPADPEPPRSTTVLGDWTANLLFIGRQQLVIAVSNITLLPVLLPAAPFKTLPSRLPDAVEQMLHALRMDRQKIAAEISAMKECVAAPTNDRRVVGSMVDFDRMLSIYLDGRPLLEVALHVAEAPCSLLKMESPRAATRALFGQIGSQSKQPALRLVKS